MDVSYITLYWLGHKNNCCGPHGAMGREFDMLVLEDRDEGNGSGTGNSKLEVSKVREWVVPLRNKQTKKLGMGGA